MFFCWIRDGNPSISGLNLTCMQTNHHVPPEYSFCKGNNQGNEYGKHEFFRDIINRKKTDAGSIFQVSLDFFGFYCFNESCMVSFGLVGIDLGKCPDCPVKDVGLPQVA